MNTQEELNDLMGGAPTATFHDIGTVHKGLIRSFEKSQQRDMETGAKKVWDDGSPMYQWIFTLETEERDPELVGDDGVRRIFAKAQMLGAIRGAIRQSGWSGNIVGGTLAVKYDSDGTPKTRGYNPPKNYVAKFEPPVESVEFMTATQGPLPDDSEFHDGNDGEYESPF